MEFGEGLPVTQDIPPGKRGALDYYLAHLLRPPSSVEEHMPTAFDTEDPSSEPQ